MDNQKVASELVAVAKLIAGDASDWQSDFPSNLRMDLRNKTYRKFDLVYKSMSRDGRNDPRVANAAKLLDKALKTFVTLNAQLDSAEEALYYDPR